MSAAGAHSHPLLLLLLLQEERDSFSAGLLGEVGLVDTFRRQHPEAVGYTYYSYRFNARTTGKGWRLDYFLVRAGLGQERNGGVPFGGEGKAEECI